MEDRKNLGFENNRSYTYGEVSFDGFKEILSVINPTAPFEFLDLGSGIGKSLVVAALLYPCKKLSGVENLSSLVSNSKTILNKFQNYIQEEFTAAEVPNLVYSKTQL